MDGESFLMLTDSDISEMVKAVGARRKLIVKRNSFLKATEVCFNVYVAVSMTKCGVLELHWESSIYLFRTSHRLTSRFSLSAQGS